jgi:outer membrane protein assembly factor BamE (lipoprotein component of BamABCDE complex)
MDNSTIRRLTPRFSLTWLLVVVALCAGALGIWRFIQTPYVGPANISRVRPGMTRTEVADLMGE